MGRIPDEDIQKVREATDIVDLIGRSVVLKQKSGNFWGCCPFHGEKTPSFKVDPSTGLYYCFGCHKHGNVFDYVMETESLSFREAVISLAEKAHIDIHLEDSDSPLAGSPTRLRELCEKTAQFYHTYLLTSRTDGAAAARAYLSGRDLNIAISKRWRLGYAPGNELLVKHLSSLGYSEEDMVNANVAYKQGSKVVDRFFNRVMFPIADASGRVIAFGGRVIGKGEPKYLNSSDTPLFHKSKNLYGLDKARKEILATKTALIVEGYTDVIALHEAGFTNAVATLGTALTAQHIKLLSRFAKRIVYIFDGDEAGLRAASRAVEFIDRTITIETNANPMILDVVILPGQHDPAEIVSKKDGETAFKACLQKAIPLIQFSIDRRLDQWDLSRPEERQRAINDAVAVLAPLKGTVMASDYARYIVDKLWASGVRLELSAVMAALESSQGMRTGAVVPTEGEEEIAPDDMPILFNIGSHINPDERLAQEAIMYMLRSVKARKIFSEGLTGDEFCFKVYSDIFLRLKQASVNADQQTLVADLSKEFKGFDRLVASHGELLSDPEEIAKAAFELIGRIKESSLERNISQLSHSLKSESLNQSEKKAVVLSIAEMQKELLALRTKRRS